MDRFKQLPLLVNAQANPYNTQQSLSDSQGNVHQVPATWWLVEFPSGLVATMPNETFTAQYERPFAAVPMEDFANTVADLRSTDRMHAQRALELEARIASLEATIASMREALSAAAPQLTFPTING
jgi:hypothetical protein